MTKQETIERAKEIMSLSPIFLDTETTGFSDTAEIVSIGIVDTDGKILLDAKVRPTIPIPFEATEVHGITDEDVKDAPPFRDVAQDILKCLAERECIIYNVPFDLRMLVQSAAVFDETKGIFDKITASCAMLLYADFYEQGRGRWQKLGAAAKQCGIEIKGRLHGAVVDAKITRELVVYMANGGKLIEAPQPEEEGKEVEKPKKISIFSVGNSVSIPSVRCSGIIRTIVKPYCKVHITKHQDSDDKSKEWTGRLDECERM